MLHQSLPGPAHRSLRAPESRKMTPKNKGCISMYKQPLDYLTELVWKLNLFQNHWFEYRLSTVQNFWLQIKLCICGNGMWWVFWYFLFATGLQNQSNWPFRKKIHSMLIPSQANTHSRTHLSRSYYSDEAVVFPFNSCRVEGWVISKEKLFFPGFQENVLKTYFSGGFQCAFSAFLSCPQN